MVKESAPLTAQTCAEHRFRGRSQRKRDSCARLMHGGLCPGAVNDQGAKLGEGSRNTGQGNLEKLEPLAINAAKPMKTMELEVAEEASSRHLGCDFSRDVLPQLLLENFLDTGVRLDTDRRACRVNNLLDDHICDLIRRLPNT